jgi:hypothetical protein
LILLAFLFPVAVYLLVLGRVNRRRTPLRVSGVWDFVGLLGALSGFLLVGGPAVLSSLSSPNWRSFWVTGQPPQEQGWPLWVVLAAAYFVVVAGGTAFLFWYQRHLTAIYNVEPGALERLLGQICRDLGLTPVRSSNLFLFGMPLRTIAPKPASSEGIQAPHYRPPRRAEEESIQASPEKPRLVGAVNDLAGETAVLEVNEFRMMWHATLRWDPAQSNLRREIEAELDRALAETPTPEHELGPWLTLIGLAMLCATLMGLILLVLNAAWQH